MKNKDIVDFLWKTFNSKKTKTLHDMSGVIVDSLIDKCFEHKSSDNLTAVLICLDNMKDMFKEKYLSKDTLDLDDEIPINTANNYNSFSKNFTHTNNLGKPHRLATSGNSSKTERSATEKKLLLNKIIKNTLSIKSKQNVKSENYISLNSK
jgi:hypothetical protein